VRGLAALSLAAVLVGSLAACGEGDGADSVGGSASATSATSDKDEPMKPTVTIPSTPPPTTLQTEDLVVGDGATAEVGKPLEVHYVGVSYSTGKQFDASWDSGQPLPFTLGSGQVIQGWDKGLIGMKVGGRRRLTIPPDMAYGASGYPPVIAPNETLVFVVDLIKVG